MSTRRAGTRALQDHQCRARWHTKILAGSCSWFLEFWTHEVQSSWLRVETHVHVEFHVYVTVQQNNGAFTCFLIFEYCKESRRSVAAAHLRSALVLVGGMPEVVGIPCPQLVNLAAIFYRRRKVRQVTLKIKWLVTDNITEKE